MSEATPSLFEQTQRLRRRLTHVWPAFFGRYGSLTLAQVQTIPLILEGQNVMLSAPTATGKTEAVAAPVAQRLLAERWSGLSVLYVVPTRALANDMHQRLEPSLRGAGVSVALKHGDKPVLPRQLPNWLITTPESLDSLLGRRPGLFANLHAVILDEIHLLDGTYRGDQLRILVRRLANESKEVAVGMHLLSATLRDPAETACRYVDGSQMVKVAGGRPIRRHFVTTIHEAAILATENQWDKLLVFCNTRKSVEETAGALRQGQQYYRVAAHHGSLERGSREEAERMVREERRAICVSTSTLEIGIDIGDIDAVVLAQPPFSVSSLMQRVGRGNRRTKKIQAVAIAATLDERSTMNAMFDLAEAGEFQVKEYVPDLSVVVQQILSSLFQLRSGISLQQLAVPLEPLAQLRVVEAIAAHLVAERWIVSQRGMLLPSTRLLDEAAKGTIHSNIPDDGDVPVSDANSGKIIGRIGRPFDAVFLLAGQSWRVVAVSPTGVTAVRLSGGGAPAQFGMGTARGKWHPFLPQALRKD